MLNIDGKSYNILYFFAKICGLAKKRLKKVWYVIFLSYLCGVFEA
jgi:hypothetical protein